MAQDDMDTDALLRDLEKRASGGATESAADGGDDEDIEAFLRGLEGDDYAAPPKEESAPAAAAARPTKVREADPLEAQFAGLEEAPDAPLAKAEPEAKPSRKERRAAKKAEKEAAKQAAKEAERSKKEAARTSVDVVERGESTGLKQLLRLGKWTVIIVPTLIACWLLGAFLSAWVSASWLIAVIAVALVLLLPLGARLLSKRGAYGWWMSGLSALMALGLTVPMPASAGRAIERYGHWPATAVAEALGGESDQLMVRAAASVSSFVGQLVHPTPEPELARKLGGELPLTPPEVVEGETPTPTPEPAPEGEAPTPTPEPAPEVAPASPTPTEPSTP